MKRILKTALLLALSAALATSSAFAQATVLKDSKPLTAGKAITAVQSGGHYLVPLKEVMTGLGGKVAYSAKDKRITVTYQGKTYQFWMGKSYYRVGSKDLTMDRPLMDRGGIAYLPAASLAQITGYAVSYSSGKLQLKTSGETALRVGTITGPTGIAMAKLISDAYLGENIRVSYDLEANAQLLPAKLLKGELDMAFVPSNTAAILYNKSKGEVQLVSTNIWGLLSVVTTDPAIKSWGDLKGKQADIFGQGATPEIAFKALAEANGLNPGKDLSYKMAYDTPGTLVAAMAAGKTKDGVAVLAEPFTSMLLAKNKNARVLFDVQTEWRKSFGLGFPMSSLVVRKDFLEAHPEAVDAFVREFSNSLAYANANPKAVGELVKKMPQLPFEAAIVAASIPRSDFKYQAAPEAKAALAKYYKALYDFDPQTIGGKLPGDDFYAKVQLDY